MKKTKDQRHGPVRVYTAAEIAEYEQSSQAQETAAKAAVASSTYGETRPHRVLMTFEDRAQRHITVMASSVEHTEDIARERYPRAVGFDVWLSTKEVQS